MQSNLDLLPLSPGQESEATLLIYMPPPMITIFYLLHRGSVACGDATVRVYPHISPVLTIASRSIDGSVTLLSLSFRSLLPPTYKCLFDDTEPTQVTNSNPALLTSLTTPAKTEYLQLYFHLLYFDSIIVWKSYAFHRNIPYVSNFHLFSRFWCDIEYILPV